MVQENCLKPQIIIICGPTGSGKSSVAIEVAKLLDTEIVCADALTVYQELNVGTAKVTGAEAQGIKHHLIDVVTPFDTFSVGDYRDKALPIIDEIISKGKIPIICGGTGFYINSILYDMSYGNSVANTPAREKYFDLAKTYGNKYVYEILKKVDPASAEKLHYNDLKRVVRALEIYESGHLKSEICDNLTPKYDYKAYSISMDREILYNRINKRVDLMIENGLVDEVQRLVNMGVSDKNQCLQAIGYKEIYSYLKNEISLSNAIDLIKLNTRHYAKRQITFFKKLDGLKYIDTLDIKLTAKNIVGEL